MIMSLTLLVHKQIPVSIVAMGTIGGHRAVLPARGGPMVMALETWRVMVGLSLMVLWYSVEQSPSVKPRIQGRHTE